MKFLRIPSGEKIEIYDLEKTNSFIVRFTEKTIEEIRTFFGSEIISFLDVVDEKDQLLESLQLGMKLKQITASKETVVEEVERLVHKEYIEKKPVITADGKEEIEEIIHPEKVEVVTKTKEMDFLIAFLEVPSVEEELQEIKSKVGIVDPNQMTLDEFREYKKSEIGEFCSKSIFSGADIETSKGKKHFGYTLEDQSNIKDLFFMAQATEFSVPVPYHVDGELCSMFEALDIIKIYLGLSNNKIYHTTYCNFLNDFLSKAEDMESIKKIQYGMDLPMEYSETMEQILKSGQNAVEKMLEKYKVDGGGV